MTQAVAVVATPAPLAACAAQEINAATEFVVGIMGPFSQNAAWPKALVMQAGAGLAVEEINQAGGLWGKPLRIALQDTTGDPALAARLAETLITQECASALVGGFTSDESAAIKQVSERYGVPFLIVDATADELTSDRSATVFRLAPTASMVAQMPAQWLTVVGDYNGDGVQQVLLIAENTPSGDQSLAQTSQVLAAVGITFDVLRVDAPAQDYSPQIARIVAREMTPDAILLYVAGETGLDLLRQLLEAGIGPAKGTLLVTGRSALDGNLFWQRVPDGVYTVVGRRGPWNTSLTPMGQNFVERFRAFSTQLPEPVAFAGYDAIQLLANAAARAASPAPSDLITALESTDVKLAAGYYHFPFNSLRPPNSPLEPEYLWHQWPDPPLLYLQYIIPQQDPATLDIIWPPIYRTVEGAFIRPE